MPSLTRTSFRPFSYSKKESESNDVLMQFEELSNVHNSDRRSNTTRSNVLYNMYKYNTRSRLFCRVAERSIINVKHTQNVLKQLGYQYLSKPC